MKVSKFFKILNRKIERYNNMVSNPFEMPQSFILVWIEEESKKNPFENDSKEVL